MPFTLSERVRLRIYAGQTDQEISEHTGCTVDFARFIREKSKKNAPAFASAEA